MKPTSGTGLATWAEAASVVTVLRAVKHDTGAARGAAARTGTALVSLAARENMVEAKRSELSNCDPGMPIWAPEVRRQSGEDEPSGQSRRSGQFGRGRADRTLSKKKTARIWRRGWGTAC